MLLFIVPLSVGTAGFLSLPAVHSPRVSMSELDPSWIRWPYARIRRELVTEQGEVRRFVAQLEYDVAATPTGQSTPDWRTVARFDHDISGEQSHDVREEGLHMDIYRNGEKERVITTSRASRWRSPRDSVRRHWRHGRTHCWSASSGGTTYTARGELTPRSRTRRRRPQ